jgi:hypothetical protein
MRYEDVMTTNETNDTSGAATDPGMLQPDESTGWTIHLGTLRIVPDLDRMDAVFFRLDKEDGEWDLNLDDGVFPPELFDWDGMRVKVLAGTEAVTIDADVDGAERIMQALRIELQEPEAA